MPLPDGVTTFALHFGPYLNSTGAPLYAGLSGRVEPSAPRRHLASGAVIEDVPVDFVIGADGTAVVVGLAHNGLAGLLPVNTGYSVDWPGATVDTPTPERKTFAVLAASGTDVDYDQLPSAAVVDGAAPVLPTVVSVVGRTGAVTAGQLEDAFDAAGGRLSQVAQRAAFSSSRAGHSRGGRRTTAETRRARPVLEHRPSPCRHQPLDWRRPWSTVPTALLCQRHRAGTAP